MVNHSDTGVAASASKVSALETTVNDATTGVSATSQALDTVETLVNHSDTGVASSATKIGLLETTVNNATTGVAATSSALDTVETLVNHSDTGVAASASKIGVLETTVNDATTGVAATSSALDTVETLVNHSDTGVSASAEKIGLLETTVNDATTGVSATAGALDTVKTLVNHSDTGVAASAEKIGLLEATVDDATTGVSATAGALDTVKILVNHSDTGVTASSNKIGVLQTTLDGPNGNDGLSVNFTNLSSAVTNSETGLSATAGKVGLLVVAVGDANSGLVQSQNATADESEATAVDITALIASLNTANGGSSTTLNAAIVAERTVRVNAESATGLLITGITNNVSNKTQTFAQDDIPTALAIGDLWIDTNDDNKLYRAKAIGANEVSSTEWVTVRDATATTSFAQSTVPTSLTIGDIWIDTSADSAGAVKNRVYRAGSVGADQITAGEWVLLDLGQALASASAISVLNTEVFPNGAASASRIDNIDAEFANPQTGTTTLAQNFTSVLSQVYPDGTGSASSLTGIVASITDKPNTFAQSSVPTSGAVGDMWINTGSNNKLYRSASKAADQIATGEWEAVNPETTTTFSQSSIPTSLTIGDIWIDTGLDIDSDVKNHFYRAESVGANETTAGEWVILDVGNAVQTASVVTLIEADVFPNGSSSASATSQISARLDNALGEDTGVTLEEKFVANADALEGLSGQYSVKIDANGHVAGFGLSNTLVNGTPSSAFIVRADKFAIVNASDTSGGLGTTTPNSDSVPFSVQAYQAPDASNGNIEIQAGVYMKSAFIANGSITTAQIGTATIDTANITGTLSANKIVGGEISTSLLNIDGATLTASSSGALQVNEINANKITAGSISATVMSGTTVYANKLLGDVATILPFRQTNPILFRSLTSSSGGGVVTVIETQLPATTHLTEGHTPFATVTGWYDSTIQKTYRFRMYMKDSTGGSGSLGAPISTSQYYTTYVTYFAGNKTGLMGAGSVLSSTGKSHTATNVNYDSATGNTWVSYTLTTGTAFHTTDSVGVAVSTAYQLVGETRFKSNTSLYGQFAISGSLGNATTGTVDLKITVVRTGSEGISDPDSSSATDYMHEVSGVLMGVH